MPKWTYNKSSTNFSILFIHETVATAVQEVIGTAQQCQRYRWFEEKVQRVKIKKNAARIRILVADTRLNRQYRADGKNRRETNSL